MSELQDHHGIQITVDRAELLEEVVRCEWIAKRRTKIPILSHVLVTIARDGIHLAATDLEMRLTTRCAAKIEGTGVDGFSIDARRLRDILKAMGSETVRLTLSGDQPAQCGIAGGAAEFTIRVVAPEDFPSYTDIVLCRIQATPWRSIRPAFSWGAPLWRKTGIPVRCAPRMDIGSLSSRRR